MKILSLFCAAFLALSFTGCGAPGRNCTLVGCANRLTLEVRDGSGGSVSAFEGEVTIGERVIQVDCSEGAASPLTGDYECGNGTVALQLFSDAPPDAIDVNLTATDDGKTFSGEIAPEKGEPSYPNGPECEPSCQNATATVTLQ